MKLNKLGVIVGAICFGAGLFVMHGAALTIPALFGLVAYVVVAWRLPDTWGQQQMPQQGPQVPVKKAKKLAVASEEEAEEDTDQPIPAPKKKDGMKLMGTVDPNDPDSYRRIIKREKDIAPIKPRAKSEVKTNKPKKGKPMNSGSGGSEVTGL